MENICQNCEYFVQVSTNQGRYAWGDCMNPEVAFVDETGEKKGVFRWADGSCIDFKPRQKPH
ncbi:MAG TPA: hypothetical protein VMW16_01910 [Sedimentisphaerales bacterium]|nr:hypothetical protein [Sedimentisphaerales bacterium]